MDNSEYTTLVDEGKFPTDMLVPLPKAFVNDAGVIQNLLLTPITSIAIITSKMGSVRSNHYHKTDWHYLYIVSGSVIYYERNIDGSDIKITTYRTGEMFFTPPLKVHKTEFLEDTIMMSFAKNVRDHEHHEEDIIRIEF
jgi:quercetin dioxygenase-like cupin family protein